MLLILNICCFITICIEEDVSNGAICFGSCIQLMTAIVFIYATLEGSEHRWHFDSINVLFGIQNVIELILIFRSKDDHLRAPLSTALFVCSDVKDTQTIWFNSSGYFDFEVFVFIAQHRHVLVIIFAAGKEEMGTAIQNAVDVPVLELLNRFLIVCIIAFFRLLSC